MEAQQRPTTAKSTPSTPTSSPFDPWAAARAATEYWIDAWQRTILTCDVLRERGNQYLEHAKSGSPPVLAFDYETVVDGRLLDRPVNYALLRVSPTPDDPPTDPEKRPFIVIDPRAGHGPGIGGFKVDSGIGIALKRAHPCYFVTFFPKPEEEQTIESVCAAEIAFTRKVQELHPNAQGKPFLIGNCQGGWALTMLAALAPEDLGPILLAGSPLSYWAGVCGKNPMRYTGGLLGGAWSASLAADMGHGKFDGAYLVNNFERLNPSNSYWKKMYDLYSKVDTERDRFLHFEKWWGGHFFMNKGEMEWIVQNLFVGNKLATGRLESFDGRHRVDIRNIRSPIVVFASWGDNITPPQQALNWIADVYRDVDDIRLNEQTIVYCLHEKIGHLGIFVSGGIARRETSELVDGLALIETLPPGLYEAIIQDAHPEMPGHEFIDGRYLIQFSPRTIDDILALDDGREDERAFEVVNRVSEINQGLYETFVSPVVRATSSDLSAETLRETNPARMERWGFSDLNPWMAWVAAMARAVREDRRPVSQDNPLLRMERDVSRQIVRSLDQYRDLRDAYEERLFRSIYEWPLLASLIGVDRRMLGRQGPRARTWEQEELRHMKQREIEAYVEEGTIVDAWARLLIYVRPKGDPADERPFNMVRRMLEEAKPESVPSIGALREAIKRQARVLALDEERAIEALPKLAKDTNLRKRDLDVARTVMKSRGELTAQQEQRFRRVESILGLNGAGHGPTPP
jgi:pimeloyl-ACP methyl ester carboxylesterase